MECELTLPRCIRRQYVLQATWCRIPEDSTCHSHRRENLKSHTYISHHSFIHEWFYSPLLGPGRLLSFVIVYTVSRTPWTGDQPVASPLTTHGTAQTQTKRTQRFEPTTPIFEQVKTGHASDCVTTVIGVLAISYIKLNHI
jgi:hypothetical protein